MNKNFKYSFTWSLNVLERWCCHVLGPKLSSWLESLLRPCPYSFSVMEDWNNYLNNYAVYIKFDFIWFNLVIQMLLEWCGGGRVCLLYLCNSSAVQKELRIRQSYQQIQSRYAKGERFKCLHCVIYSDDGLQDSNFKLLCWFALESSLALALNLSQMDI